MASLPLSPEASVRGLESTLELACWRRWYRVMDAVYAEMVSSGLAVRKSSLLARRLTIACTCRKLERAVGFREWLEAVRGLTDALESVGLSAGGDRRIMRTSLRLRRLCGALALREENRVERCVAQAFVCEDPSDAAYAASLEAEAGRLASAIRRPSERTGAYAIVARVAAGDGDAVRAEMSAAAAQATALLDYVEKQLPAPKLATTLEDLADDNAASDVVAAGEEDNNEREDQAAPPPRRHAPLPQFHDDEDDQDDDQDDQREEAPPIVHDDDDDDEEEEDREVIMRRGLLPEPRPSSHGKHKARRRDEERVWSTGEKARRRESGSSARKRTRDDEDCDSESSVSSGDETCEYERRMRQVMMQDKKKKKKKKNKMQSSPRAVGAAAEEDRPRVVVAPPPPREAIVSDDENDDPAAPSRHPAFDALAAGRQQRDLVLGRTGRAARSRKRWSAEEEAELVDMYKTYGPAWALIAKRSALLTAAGRTGTDVKDKIRNLSKKDPTLFGGAATTYKNLKPAAPTSAAAEDTPRRSSLENDDRDEQQQQQHHTEQQPAAPPRPQPPAAAAAAETGGAAAAAHDFNLEDSIKEWCRSAIVADAIAKVHISTLRSAYCRARPPPPGLSGAVENPWNPVGKLFRKVISSHVGEGSFSNSVSMDGKNQIGLVGFRLRTAADDFDPGVPPPPPPPQGDGARTTPHQPHHDGGDDHQQREQGQGQGDDEQQRQDQQAQAQEEEEEEEEEEKDEQQDEDDDHGTTVHDELEQIEGQEESRGDATRDSRGQSAEQDAAAAAPETPQRPSTIRHLSPQSRNALPPEPAA